MTRNPSFGMLTMVAALAGTAGLAFFLPHAVAQQRLPSPQPTTEEVIGAAFKAPTDVIAAAPASAWRAIPPDELVVFALTPDAAGKPRRFVMQLLPPIFANPFTANVRVLASTRWWDGSSIYRVQDNWVAQWGDATDAKALPAGLAKPTQADFTLPVARIARLFPGTPKDPGQPPPQGTVQVRDWRWRDSYAPFVTHAGGWPIGIDGDEAWPLHCHGMVGVARGLSPDAGTAAELYTVIGHAPRQLDRNIGIAGRVVEGIELLSALPRGGDRMGFYGTAEERVPIVSARLASDLPAANRPRLEMMDTNSPWFARLVHAAANRKDDFYSVPAGGIDICNIKVPVREAND